jgi:DNA-binding helix-hairpin-helix protein with protein kinase domain
MSDVVVGNQPIKLGQRIGKGGEGEVYAASGSNQVAIKIYTKADKREKEAKILAMIEAGLTKNCPFVAFPIEVVRSRDGSFLGFSMRKVEGHKPIHNLYGPGSRKQHFPGADYRFLVQVATNIARAFASVHQTGCVVGDINHSSILVAQDATVALIDADSFQLTVSTQKFLCTVAVPEYTSPELFGTNLSVTPRTPNHDAFGLAVMIFQLLFMGRHPYVGIVRSGEAPPLQENIRNHRFVYAEHRNVGMDQPAGTPVLSDFTTEIAQAFERAFSNKTSVVRPSAREWIRLLEQLKNALVKCDKNTLHYSPQNASECLWCAMENQFGTPMFVPFIKNFTAAYAAFSLHTSKFNLVDFWRSVESLGVIDLQAVRPKLRAVQPQGNEAAIAALNPQPTVPWIGMTIVIGMLILAATTKASGIWMIFAAVAAYFCYQSYTKTPTVDSRPFIDAFKKADAAWGLAVKRWYARCDAGYFAGINELRQLRQQYQQLEKEQDQQIKLHRASRENAQLSAFLSQYDIQRAALNGITQPLAAALRSFGFETAADVHLNYRRLTDVPGIGEVKAQRLIDWQKALVKRFVYNPHDNDLDKQRIAAIHVQIQSKAQQLSKKMIDVFAQVAQSSSQVEWLLKNDDVQLNQLHEQRESAIKDLQLLGILVPATPAYIAEGIDEIRRKILATSQALVVPAIPVISNWSNASRQSAQAKRTVTPPVVATPSPAPVAAKTSVSCPRCGSGMTQRLARKGSYSGSYFWGCNRYPACKGIRNI